ncbi:Integral membrane protein [Neofusicoccum parvum]|uniref:Integral membrane protein n=1 Tax=Neofusicoccum parvum TaxID=310453 RepID=A0ACB5SQD3_9PEZI|nr:Integral membrane protein [Neofusicoccum parvum]GME63652.1 Integral membrane protein [Neofusicoccum parvum]
MTTGPEATVACFVCAGIATIFVGLRLFTRFIISRHPGWDDFLVTVALVFSIALCPIYWFQLKYGLGDHLKDIPPQVLVKQMVWFWASTWIYLTGVAFAKISILIQYIRVFVGVRTILAAWATVAFIITCCLVCLFGGIFACSPVEKFWNPTVPGTCINYIVIWYLHSAMAISTDFAIVIIPLPTIFNMNLETKKKWSLAFTFALGGFGCVTSIIRLYYLYFLTGTKDTTHYNPIPALWSTVELNVVIVCACLITLHPLLVRVLSPIKRFASQYSQNRSRSQRDPALGGAGDGRSSRTTTVWGGRSALSDGKKSKSSGGIGLGTTLLDEGSDERLAPLEEGPRDAIKIETRIDLVAEEGRSVDERTLVRGRSESSFKGGGKWEGEDLEMYRMV